jgi:hypothetical protein
MRISCFCSMALLAALGCSSKAPATSAPAPVAPGEPAAAQPTSQSAATATEAVSAGGLTWTARKPFVSRTPKSSMRAAEYAVEGDEAAELAVFYFGADQGGPVEANISRWVAQFTQADGSETKPKRSERSVRGNAVALVEAHGTYSGGMAMPGMPPKAAQTDAALLGAIAKGPAGSVFFKLVGPRESVERARPAFDALVESLQVAP